MADEQPVNYVNPPITVHYRNLIRAQDGALRSRCPFCADGVLLLVRHQETAKLLDLDRCIGCGQSVVYADLKEAFPMVHDDKAETKYDREVGFVCRRCGHDVTPVYTGNALTSFHCTHCDEDFMP